ncbi:putative acetyltransferase [Corynebacterium occultum]|uniref:Putative acetyltransferase n=1 Tax=Corynebacterium occultum TaxID=2675219 RepID=A0A6B8W980_9CORY|nr:GNAT family N-acetyltransferase [Corynebacterium occultum]QGU06560.1 putative acetyltransferase [Corynebacterium occultum]
MESSEFLIRPATESDRTFLARMFYLTDVLGDETRRVSETFLKDRRNYVDFWTPDQGGLVAFSPAGVPAGAVWLRAGDNNRPRYGFIDTDIPELAIAVEKRYSGRGLATRLIREILDASHQAGAPAVSLAVDEGNERARDLYLMLGFQVYEDRAALGTAAMIYRFPTS